MHTFSNLWICTHFRTCEHAHIYELVNVHTTTIIATIIATITTTTTIIATTPMHSHTSGLTHSRAHLPHTLWRSHIAMRKRSSQKISKRAKRARRQTFDSSVRGLPDYQGISVGSYREFNKDKDVTPHTDGDFFTGYVLIKLPDNAHYQLKVVALPGACVGHTLCLKFVGQQAVYAGKEVNLLWAPKKVIASCKRCEEYFKSPPPPRKLQIFPYVPSIRELMHWLVNVHTFYNLWMCTYFRTCECAHILELVNVHTF